MSHAAKIDELMERASRLLEATDYLPCETACMEALSLARRAGDYDRIARIMMPLQEVRRQRRQIAEDAGVFVMTGHHRKPQEILDKHPAGCLLLTDPPYTAEDEQTLRDLARQRGCFVEVLRMQRGDLRSAFLAGLERRGDASLACLDAFGSQTQKIDQLLDQLDAIGDHELVHQRIAEYARQATHGESNV